MIRWCFVCLEAVTTAQSVHEFVQHWPPLAELAAPRTPPGRVLRYPRQVQERWPGGNGVQEVWIKVQIGKNMPDLQKSFLSKIK